MSDRSATAARKDELRRAFSSRRAAMNQDARQDARRLIADVILGFRPSGGTVAAYEPMLSEPGSVELLSRLCAAGYEVIVPVTQTDRDLHWRRWQEQAPTTDLGPDYLNRAGLVLVPALAADRSGNRLGRGGGSYDRALTRVEPGAITAALLFSDELVEDVPVDGWDIAVNAVITPTGVLYTPIGGRNTR